MPRSWRPSKTRSAGSCVAHRPGSEIEPGFRTDGILLNQADYWGDTTHSIFCKLTFNLMESAFCTCCLPDGTTACNDSSPDGRCTPPKPRPPTRGFAFSIWREYWVAMTR